MHVKIPTRAEALALLNWAEAQNPGPWDEHSQSVAMAAERIAQACAMDVDAAWCMGLLHDIGRYEGRRTSHHVYAGRELMLKKGYPEIARICLTHSFPVKDWECDSVPNDCTVEESAELAAALDSIEYDDCDRLIQLCDAITWGKGVCLLEKRIVDVSLRYGMQPHTIDKWRAWFEIKAYFEQKIGGSIYSLFEGVWENSI